MPLAHNCHSDDHRNRPQRVLHLVVLPPHRPASVAGTCRCRVRVLVPSPACSTFLVEACTVADRSSAYACNTAALMSPASMGHGPTESWCGSVLYAGHGPAASLTRRVAPTRPATATTVDLVAPAHVVLLQYKISRRLRPGPALGRQPSATRGHIRAELPVVALLDLVAAAVDRVAATIQEPDEAPGFQFDLVFCHL